MESYERRMAAIDAEFREKDEALRRKGEMLRRRARRAERWFWFWQVLLFGMLLLDRVREITR